MLREARAQWRHRLDQAAPQRRQGLALDELRRLHVEVPAQDPRSWGGRTPLGRPVGNGAVRGRPALGAPE
eukprot:4724395-Lingulodinium_polyedra.AAC.1